MDRRTYSFECPVTSTTDMSCYSTNTTPNLSLDLGLFRHVHHQGASSAFDKAYTPGPYPSVSSTPLQVVHEPHLGSPFVSIHQEGLKLPAIPVQPPSSLFRTTFIRFINSSQQGRESVSLAHDHQSSPAHPTSYDLSAPSAFPVISYGQTIVQDKERRAPKRPHLFQKPETDSAAALLRSSQSLKLGEKPGVSQGRHSCSICNLDYAQPQGLTRHQHEKHKAKLCIYCGEFAWGRRYLFRKHLVNRHPGVDPDTAINEAARTRRSVTIRRRYAPLPKAPNPTPNCDSWDRIESQSRLGQLMSPPAQPPAVTRLSPVFIAYDSQSESTLPANKEMHGQEDALPLELPSANDERAASSSIDEYAEAATNLDMSARTVKMWFKDNNKSVSLVKFAAVDIPSKSAPALAPVPTPTPPLNGYNGSHVVVSPIVEQAEHAYFFLDERLHPPHWV